MFSERKAQLAVNFFERLLTHTKGEYARQPFKLWPFQRKPIRDIFGTLRADGLRQYRTAYWEIPKKNGKSEVAAGIALTGLFLDDEPGAEIYGAAATRDQASIIFRIAAGMVRNEPVLNERCRIIDSTKTIFLKSDPNSFYKAISADAATQDGINPHMVVFDELHRQTKRDLHSVLKYGMATRRQPLLFEITTAGVESESPLCWEEHEYARAILEGTFEDPTFYACIYGLDQDADWTFEGEPEHDGRPATGWYKANPALGLFLPVEVMRTECEQAKRLPRAQNEFRRFRLNQWTQTESRWIPLTEWDQCAASFDIAELEHKPCWGAIDLSTVVDITSLGLVFPWEEDGQIVYRILQHFWLPEKELYERSQRDRVPYDLWADQGIIELTPGNYIDHGFIKKTLDQMATRYDIREMAYDPWNCAQLAAELSDQGMTMVEFRQGFHSFNEPSKAFERAILARSLRHNGNPVLRWMMDSTTVATDPTGSIKPVKPDRLKSTKRIDGIVTSIMALGRARAGENGAISFTGVRSVG